MYASGFFNYPTDSELTNDSIKWDITPHDRERNTYEETRTFKFSIENNEKYLGIRVFVRDDLTYLDITVSYDHSPSKLWKTILSVIVIIIFLIICFFGIFGIKGCGGKFCLCLKACCVDCCRKVCEKDDDDTDVN